MFIQKIRTSFAQLWPLLVGGVFFVALSLTNPFSGKHVLRNLEPYPDGLFFIGSAQHFAQGRGINLVYQDYTLRPKVPPLYAIVLSPVYLFWQAPQAFFIVNAVLAVLSMVMLFLALRASTKHQWLQALGLLIYATHGYLLVFVGLPMAENLGLTLTIVAVYLMQTKSMTKTSILWLLLVGTLLVFTKYVYIPSAVCIWLFALYRMYKRRDWQHVTLASTFFSAAAIALALYFYYIDFNPLVAFAKTPTTASTAFFSFSVSQSLATLVQYVRLFFATHARVLWFSYPLTTFFLPVSMLLLGLKYGLPKKEPHVWWLLLLAGAPLLLLQFFYVVDGRYIFTAIPVLVTVFVWQIDRVVQVQQKYRRAVIGVVAGVVLLSQLALQAPFYKYLLATNLLFRSRAWQYEAALVVNTELAHADYFITALPPYFVKMYEVTPTAGRLLPLSQEQEFIDKNIPAWGTDIDYSDLPKLYESVLHAGKTVYITNAYVTHAHEVTQDFEALKQQFKLELVTTGCEHNCDVFRLSLN